MNLGRRLVAKPYDPPWKLASVREQVRNHEFQHTSDIEQGRQGRQGQQGQQGQQGRQECRRRRARCGEMKAWIWSQLIIRSCFDFLIAVRRSCTPILPPPKGGKELGWCRPPSRPDVKLWELF